MSTRERIARWQHEMAERAESLGWLKLSGSNCPRVVAGKRCKGERCWCNARELRSVLCNDHGRTWDGGEGGVFVLWEPYGERDFETYAKVAKYAHDDGLVVNYAPSVWNPPLTIGIMFSANRDGRKMTKFVDGTTVPGITREELVAYLVEPDPRWREIRLLQATFALENGGESPWQNGSFTMDAPLDMLEGFTPRCR